MPGGRSSRKCLDKAFCIGYFYHRHLNGQRDNRGLLAQLDRALVSGTKGRVFESPIAHHR